MKKIVLYTLIAILALTATVLPISAQTGEGAGLIRVTDESGQTGFINAQGEVIVEPQFGGAQEFSEGLAGVLVEGKWGFIDETGQMVIEPQFLQVNLGYANQKPVLFVEGLAPVEADSGQFGYIDSSGEFVIEPQFSWVSTLMNGLAYVEIRGDDGVTQQGYINPQGEFVWGPLVSPTGGLFGSY